MPKKSKLKIVDDSSVEEPKINSDTADAGEIFNSVGELVVDVFETESEFVVLSAIAGIQIKDLDIAVDKDMMVISGQRQDPHLDTDKKYIRQECYWGPFSKKIVLPENIDVQKADAQMSKGVLVVKIPKMSNMEEAGVESA
ncbi:MAG: Hsp20/alpha crystallin family protein [Candidatus Staskawiczbacteria bacterium]|nr:Hsp20/alpha crystallin family protein [Candidatus Staskawiczbacteria bacterium]